jgi:hypothetical protein
MPTKKICWDFDTSVLNQVSIPETPDTFATLSLPVYAAISFYLGFL